MRVVCLLCNRTVEGKVVNASRSRDKIPTGLSAARDRPSLRGESLGHLRSIIVKPDRVKEFVSRLSLVVRRQQGLRRQVNIANEEEETENCLSSKTDGMFDQQCMALTCK